MPALFTSKSIRPKCLIAAFITWTAVSFLLASPSTRTRRGDAWSSFDLLIVREVPTTLQPRSRRAWVMPKPIPLEAPVTMATGCSDLFMIAFLSCFGMIWFGLVIFRERDRLRTGFGVVLGYDCFHDPSKHRLCDL